LSLFFINRDICFWSTELEYQLTLTAPKETFLNRVLKNAKKNGKICEVHTNSYDLSNVQNMVMLLNRHNTYGTGSIISSFIQDKVFFSSETPMFESVAVFYYRKNYEKSEILLEM
jgi:hypothetical protein